MSDGLCQCGCGLPTKIADKTYPSKGWVKGQPKMFRLGHRRRKHPLGTKNYPYLGEPGAPRRKTHLARAEKAIGRPLPKGAQVHHVDGTKHPQSPLVICQDQAYHRLLHARTRILRAGGDPNVDRMCGVCGPQPASAFTAVPGWTLGVHRICKKCRNERARARYAKRAA